MNWTVWTIIHILGFVTPDFLLICVIIMASLLKFRALIWMGVSNVTCLTAVQIRHMIRLFELWCECTPIRRHFKNLSCVTSVFFTFTVHFASNPLGEICYIHLNCTAVVRHRAVCRKLLYLNQLHINCSYSEGFNTVLCSPVYLGPGTGRWCHLQLISSDFTVSFQGV